MKPRRSLILIALVWTGCSSVGEDETKWQCLSSCENNVTFTLANPVPGREIAIAVGEPDGSVLQVDCQRGEGSVACLPVGSPLKVTFDVGGALQSIKISYPPSGTYAVQILADGAPAAAGTFPFEPTVLSSDPSPCPVGSVCLSSQAFTISN